MSILVYGYSDDLILVKWDGRTKELQSGLDETETLTFSNGMLVQVSYTAGGTWEISPDVIPSTWSVSVIPGEEYDDIVPDYSQVLQASSVEEVGTKWVRKERGRPHVEFME